MSFRIHLIITVNSSNNFFNPNQFPVQSSGPQNYSNFRIPSYLQIIYKLNNNILQLGEITCDNKILSNLINTLSLGDKFVPNFFLNKRSFLF